ncbi:serine/threonine-protein kinase LATS1 isoform X2 [Ischnura elegans]|uniref:serine/threonine-protein kinase LATS1 isoform X2 n=1 Tax=Ischnura elegans TaxID=197161 RepID=UPI001ED8B323|nr:serine/threonine-protein kinase LATS1 isoform X2 [Ischnura elegans]
MGQQTNMNPAVGKSSTRSSGYHQKALAQIRNSLLPFANSGENGSSAASTISTLSTTSGVSSASGLSNASGSTGLNGFEKDLALFRQAHQQIVSMGYTEERALKGTGGRLEPNLDLLISKPNCEQPNGLGKLPATSLSTLSSKLIRKPSLERDLHRGSPALDSGAGSSRSDSPRLAYAPQPSDVSPLPHPQLSRQYSPSNFSEPPPPTPPRCGSSSGPPSTPPPPPHLAPQEYRAQQFPYGAAPTNMQQRLKRMSPAPPCPTPQRGTSPVTLGGNGGVGSGGAGSRQPMIVQNGPQAQQQLSQQMQALSMYPSGAGGAVATEPPPPYPTGSSAAPPVPPPKLATPPPSYTASLQSRQSPTQDYRKSPSMYSAHVGAAPPAPAPPSSPCSSPASPTASTVARPTPLQACWSRQAKTQPPIIMQSVKSTQVQKPVLQTAIAPTAPPTAAPGPSGPPPPPSYASSIQQKQPPPAPPPYGLSLQPPPPAAQKPEAPPPPGAQTVSQSGVQASVAPQSPAPFPAATTAAPVISIPTTDPPSYASTMQALAAQRGMATQVTPAPAAHLHHHLASPGAGGGGGGAGPSLPPPPPYGLARALPSTPPPDTVDALPKAQVATVESSMGPRPSPGVCPASSRHQYPMPLPHHQPLQRKYSPVIADGGAGRSESPGPQPEGRAPPRRPPSPDEGPPPPPAHECTPAQNGRHSLPPANKGGNHNNNHTCGNGGAAAGGATGNGSTPPAYKINHQSPIPERKHMSKEKEEERRDSKVRNYSPQAFKFYMEQHVENLMKSHQQRMVRRMQLENEMAKIELSAEARCQMRKMLSQKESNYIRLKRAKMDKSMFTKIKPIGVGAFGEVALVKKIDTKHLYAMKTLRKADVLKRNQVAHVKAERDILAEADNEWVVKLYYSFQDKDNLYFVMDYIPGGDLMSLLIKLGIFQEPLARFYIAELTCAVESVHKMGFIHRDIKPDNILIDRDGHIKLTDFGLCTGFRWTHNSKYYQRNEHGRQDSMDPAEDWSNECRCHQLKPLERRRRREHQRCLAHSLVGTPNYIAPEVLLRTGYTQLCDWWSVGVILYEMLVGQPPFLANTPAETQLKVINWETTLHIPPQANLSPEGKDLILKLCTGSDTRLGRNAAEVKAHAFFSSIDFEKGLRRQSAPHIPQIHFPTDTSNFDPVDPDRLHNGGGTGGSELSDEWLDNARQPFHGFFEFTFRRFFDDGGGGPVYHNRISLDDNDNPGPVYV